MLAWITGRAAQFALGPAAQSLAAVLGLTVAMAAIIGGLWWIRSDAARDARADERNRCTVERLLANSEAIEAQRAADAQASQAAHRARAAWLESLDKARREVADLEAELARRPLVDGKRIVVYPRALARELNR